MKVLDIPKSGRAGLSVCYPSRFGNCQRAWVLPKDPHTPGQRTRRRSFGRLSGAWSGVLTQTEREAWNVAGPKVQSKKRLAQSGKLTGQQFFQGICSARACIGADMLRTPPAPIVFGPNVTGQMTISNGENGVRLLLSVTGPVTEDIMVFGQAPCSVGRMKRRNVAYLGLLPAPQDGMSDITDIYIAKYGEPRPGEKVFIVTRQQKDGWEGLDHETNEIVPQKPAGQQAAATGTLTLQVYMHKGCTRDAQGTLPPAIPEQKAGDSLVMPGLTGGDPAGQRG